MKNTNPEISDFILPRYDIYFQHMYLKKRIIVFKGNCVMVFTFVWQSTSPFFFPKFELKEFLDFVQNEFQGDKVNRTLDHCSISSSPCFIIGIASFFDSQWFFMWYFVTALGEHKRAELRHSSFKKSESGVCQFQVKYNCKVTSFKKDM